MERLPNSSTATARSSLVTTSPTTVCDLAFVFPFNFLNFAPFLLLSEPMQSKLKWWEGGRQRRKISHSLLITV